MDKPLMLERHIPLAFVFTLIVQVGSAVWWVSQKDAQDHFRDQRLQVLEINHARSDEQDLKILERLASIEAHMEESQMSLRRIEALLQKNK